MMLPATHFVLSIGIAFCLEFKHPRKYSVILLLGLVGTLPDLDHFLPLYNGASLFHNTLVLGIIPLAMIMISGAVETQRGGNSSFYQRFFVCVAVILFSHLMLDMIAGNAVQFGFPTSVEGIRLLETPLLESSNMGIIMATTDILWICILALVLLGNLVQKKIYMIFEGYEEFPELGRAPFPYRIRNLLSNQNSLQ